MYVEYMCKAWLNKVVGGESKQSSVNSSRFLALQDCHHDYSLKTWIYATLK